MKKALQKLINFFSKIHQAKRGFTLTEALVTIFVIGMISSMMIVNWRRSESQYQLLRAAQQIAQDIRKAQDFALSGKQMFWPPTGQWIVPKSYGIHFSLSNPTFYFIYGDYIGNEGYQSPEDIEETNAWLEQGVEIYSFGGGNVKDVIFSIPDGFVSFYPSGNSATITIARSGYTCPSTNCKDIVVNSTGEISIR